MTQHSIQFKNVSKDYIINTHGSYASLRDSIGQMFRFGGKNNKTFQALTDVSFTINKGEVVSLIGHNGAGKSTILKLISNITQPSQGQVDIHGRVATLMELGAGFHYELSGRENIAFFAAILGMNKKDVVEFTPQIIEFSGLGEFIDVPVKKYSSGMQLRLGFSIAIHVKPDIFLLDEILAVGDKEFVAKCLQKIEEILASDITVILVSHNEEMVRRIAQRGILMNKGQLLFDGSVDEAYKEYNKSGGRQ